MKELFRSNNRFYCLTNIVVCILCTGYLYTGYCGIDSEVQHDETELIVENDKEPVSTSKDNNTQKVVTTAKSNTSSKKYVKPNYDSVTGEAVVDYAKKYLGLRYVSGGNSLTTGTDCSGFTKLIYKEFGIKLSRGVKAQAKNGSYVKKSDLQKGDLIFYGQKAGVVSHVGIYIGNGKVIHQSNPRDGVKITTMNIMVYITARRVISSPATERPDDANSDIVEDKNENTNILPPTDSNQNDNYTGGEYDKNDNNNVDNNITNDSQDKNESQDNNDDINQDNNQNNNEENNENNNSQDNQIENNNSQNNSSEEIYTNNEYGTGI